MKIASNKKILLRNEILFQIILNILLFLSFAVNPPVLDIKTYHFFYYLNYFIGAIIISYYLLPKYFFKLKYKPFFIYAITVVIVIMLIEEFVLEQIFFPLLKGSNFGNIFINLVDVLPIIVILCGFKFAWEAAKKQKEIIILKELVKESELQFLKNQINPHFLFNNLNNLYSYALENSKKTPSIILDLSSVLRYMLYDCREDFVPLKKELDHLVNFTKLNELQIENRGNVNLNISPIDKEYTIAPLILTVFIENAFKHSTASQSDKILIDLNIKVKNNALIFTCVNSYGNLSNNDNLPKGIGLQNVIKRLNFIYNNNYTLDFKNENNLYKVYLTINLKTE